jgi:hypothetical protein
MCRYAAVVMISALCSLWTAGVASQGLPAGVVELRASTFADRLGDVLKSRGQDFVVTLRPESDRSYSLHYSKQPEGG